MNYKDLADLIFPNAKEISYYEEKYPERDWLLISTPGFHWRLGESQ